MTTRKRKSPKGKGKRRQPGLASHGAVAIGTLGLRGAGMLGAVGVRGAGALGGLIGRHPSIAGGAMAFAVIFSFVAANALWYQPGAHPSPLFRTRDPSSFYSLGRRPFFALQKQDQSNVTTFRIERPGDDASAAPAAGTATATAQQAAAPGTAATRLVAGVQSELGRRGIYDGNADGVMGPRTSAAIIFFQESAGLPQTGEASPELLAALQASDNKTATVPAERPPEDLHSKSAAIDPVAAAIMNAEKPIKTASSPKKPPTDLATSARPATPAKVTDVAKPADAAKPGDAVGNAKLVMQIQKGLSNIAYSDVSVDGVAGDQTKAAIRHFQKHYRLPETGEPDVAVLKKLQDIGAL
jgi:peptidoglycan hydrolase-like protein with peptidoglycan-binding domain